MRPALVAVAHGTRDTEGPQVIAGLLRDVRLQLPGVEVVTAWVELLNPGLHEVMTGMTRPAVVVPLLLSTGYHFNIDVPAAAALSPMPVHVAAPLGPNRHLARATTARLRQAGAVWGDAVVLAAAGSTDPAGLTDVERAAELLRSEWGPWVTSACVSSGTGPDLPDAVEYMRQIGACRVCVAPYLLAPGHFLRRVTDLAAAAGATVAPVLGDHRLVAELVVDRYRRGCRALASTFHPAA